MLSLDHVNNITDFISLGMCDPFNPEKGLSEAKEYIDNLTFHHNIYEGKILSDTKPPKTIFIPTKELKRRIIKACIYFGQSEPKEAFFMRFGLLDNHFEILQIAKNKRKITRLAPTDKNK